jgi:hypothetical protein
VASAYSQTGRRRKRKRGNASRDSLKKLSSNIAVPVGSGYVLRNECVRQFPAILRFSVRIQNLEDEGYVFRGDYICRLISKPQAKTLELKF